MRRRLYAYSIGCIAPERTEIYLPSGQLDYARYGLAL